MNSNTGLPIDIKLPERVPMEGGALFVSLHTIGELEAFWNAHRNSLPFAAQGVLIGDQQHFLNEFEWIFAPTKAALVKAVTRWDQVGIRCEWFDWAGSQPSDHAAWFRDRDHYREQQLSSKRWTVDDQRAYEVDCTRRTSESYRGWWTLTNLPMRLNFDEWMSAGAPELIDPTMPVDTASTLLQEMTFDDWRNADITEVQFHTAASVDHEIEYWKSEKVGGQDYYGRENEPYLASAH